MAQINTIVINIILDGQNYSEWAFCVETALRGAMFRTVVLFYIISCSKFM